MATSNFNRYFPGYDILGELGRGNARVLKARNQITGELVAIKHFALHTDAATLHRFQRESEIMTSIQHPNVVRIRDVQLEAELPYIVMELVEGGDLRSLLNTHRSLDVPTIVRLGLQMAEAFRAIHEKAIIHRDIKPENIMYRMLPSGEYHFLLTDFGVAKLRERPGTLTGAAMMTYEYASPEQFDNPQQVGTATDYYAMGVVLYECLTGTPPFMLQDGRVHSLMNEVMHNPPPPLRMKTGSYLPPALERLIGHMLAKRPEERLSSVMTFKLGLKQAELEELNGGGAAEPERGPAPDLGTAARAQAKHTMPAPDLRTTARAQTKNTMPDPAPAVSDQDAPGYSPPVAAPPERRSGTTIWIVIAALLTLIMIGLIIVREYAGSSLRTRQEPDVVMPVPASDNQLPADTAVAMEADGSDSPAEDADNEMADEGGDTSIPGYPGASRAYAFVDQMPVFNGDLNTYLSANIRYPEYARQNEEEGRAVVRFVIDTDGSVTDVEVVRSSGSELLDAEALRVVSGMPPWTPGRDAGETVRVYFTLPVTFKLD